MNGLVPTMRGHAHIVSTVESFSTVRIFTTPKMTPMEKNLCVALVIS